MCVVRTYRAVVCRGLELTLAMVVAFDEAKRSTCVHSIGMKNCDSVNKLF